MKYGTMTYLEIDNHILMIEKEVRENDPNSGKYTLPGGKLEAYEKGLDTQGRLESAIRETKDETGFGIVDPIFRGTILFDNSEMVFDNWKNPDDFLVYMFVANNYDSMSKLKKSDEGMPLWVPKNDILTLPMNEGDKKIYEWLGDGRNFMGTIYRFEKRLDLTKTFVDWF